MAFVLSQRLQSVIHTILDQSGYIKKRFIGNNIRLVEDIIEYSSKPNTLRVLMFLDFKKAFDSLIWDFLHMVLSKLGFGESLKKWVLYNNPELIK